MAAFSLIELLFILGIAATIAGIAVPQATRSLDDLQAAGAARYIAARLQQTRMEAVSRTRDTALRFGRSGSGYTFAVYVDGNRNGIRTSDIADGIDVAISPLERLGEQFPNVDFGVLPALPAVSPEEEVPGTDPIRLGSGGLATFTSAGTSSTGSLYVRGRGTSQFVVRLFGQTGKTRILRFNPQSRTWVPL